MKKMLSTLLPGNVIVPVIYVVGFGAFVLIGTLVAHRRQPNQPLWAWETETDTPTQPLPSVPIVRPAWMFDNSDTSPECPECYIEHLRFSVLPRNEDGGYVMPAGDPVICARHAATTLAKALREKETTR